MHYTSQQQEEIKAPEQESIFTEVFDYTPLKKNLKNGRTWLFVIAAIQLIMGVVEYSAAENNYVGWAAFGIDAFIGAVFFALALWSRKKPRLAFTIALVSYLVITLTFIMIDMSNLYRGIFLKIIVVIALVKANRDARKYEDIKRSLGEEI
jgi:hypothetical protein